MPLPVHDVTASTVNLARMIRSGLDLKQDETKIRTDTLRLILETFISHAAPAQNMQIDQSARKSLTHMIAPEILNPRKGDLA